MPDNNNPTPIPATAPTREVAATSLVFEAAPKLVLLSQEPMKAYGTEDRATTEDGKPLSRYVAAIEGAKPAALIDFVAPESEHSAGQVVARNLRGRLRRKSDDFGLASGRINFSADAVEAAKH